MKREAEQTVQDLEAETKEKPSQDEKVAES
jgi:hypothetical protein